MKNKTLKKHLSVILIVALFAAVMTLFAGCTAAPAETTDPPLETFIDGDKLGQGATRFTLIVKGADGTEKVAEVHTDKETVGDALVELSLIGGDMGDYGLYVMTVNGEYHRYEEDGYYWAFYIDGETALTGVDSTPVIDGAVYTLAAEAAA